MKNIPTYQEFINESKIEKLNKNIVDNRGKYDISDTINSDVNLLTDIAKTVFKENKIKINSIELNSNNKFYNYELSIKGDENDLYIYVDMGFVGLEDHREGYIKFTTRTKSDKMNKNSMRFGDVKINIEENKNMIKSKIKNIL